MSTRKGETTDAADTPTVGVGTKLWLVALELHRGRPKCRVATVTNVGRKWWYATTEFTTYKVPVQADSALDDATKRHVSADFGDSQVAYFRREDAERHVWIQTNAPEILSALDVARHQPRSIPVEVWRAVAKAIGHEIVETSVPDP